MHRFTQNLSAFTLYFVLVSLVFTGVIVGRGVFFAGDITQHYVPWESFIDEEFEQGRFPLWNPGFFCGHPMHAEGQSGTLYPISRLVYRFFDGSRAFSIDMLLHLVLGGFFLYLLGRRIRLGFYSSLYSGMVFALAGYPVCLIVNAPILRSATWVPLIVLYLWSIWQENRTRGSMMLAICLTLQILAGSLQIFAYTLVLILLISILHLISRLVSKQPVIIHALLRIIAAILLAGIMSAGQWLPTLELYQKSFINLDAAKEEALTYSFSPYHLLDLIVPPYWAQDTDILANESIPFQMTLFLYIGTIPFLMALIGFFFSRTSWIWKLISVIGILCGLGGYTFFYPVMMKIIPILGYFRAPDRLLIFYALSASLLAGYGFRYFLGKELPPDPGIKRKWIVALVILAAILLAGGLLIDSYMPGSMEKLYDKLKFSVSDLISLSNILTNLGMILDAAKIELLVSALLFIILLAATIRFRRTRGRTMLIGTLIFLMSFCEAGYYHKLNPGTRLVSEDFFTKPPSSVEAIRFAENESVPLLETSGNSDSSTEGTESNTIEQVETIDPFRVTSVGVDSYSDKVFGNTPLMLWYHGGSTIENFTAFREILHPNIGNISGLEYVDGISSLYTSRWNKFMSMYHFHENLYMSDPDFFRTHLHFWDLCGVRYIISDTPLPEGRLELIHHDGVSVYKNNRAQPRAFVLYPEQVLPETPPVMDALVTGELDPVNNLVLSTGKENFYKRQPTPNMAKSSPVTIEKYQSSHIVISGIAISDGYLILTDAYDTGWVCRINNEIRNFYRAYGYFRAVPVKAGRFTASFEYKPVSYRYGMILTYIGVLIWLAFLLITSFARHKPDASSEDEGEDDIEIEEHDGMFRFLPPYTGNSE